MMCKVSHTSLRLFMSCWLSSTREMTMNMDMGEEEVAMVHSREGIEEAKILEDKWEEMEITMDSNNIACHQMIINTRINIRIAIKIKDLQCRCQCLCLKAKFQLPSVLQCQACPLLTSKCTLSSLPEPQASLVSSSKSTILHPNNSQPPKDTRWVHQESSLLSLKKIHI